MTYYVYRCILDRILSFNKICYNYFIYLFILLFGFEFNKNKEGICKYL